MCVDAARGMDRGRGCVSALNRSFALSLRLPTGVLLQACSTSCDRKIHAGGSGKEIKLYSGENNGRGQRTDVFPNDGAVNDTSRLQLRSPGACRHPRYQANDGRQDNNEAAANAEVSGFIVCGKHLPCLSHMLRELHRISRPCRRGEIQGTPFSALVSLSV